jgi:fatty acid desaturase
LLRYRQDRRALTVIVATLALLAGPLVARPEWPLSAAWFILNCCAVFCCCVINHNHVHVRMGRTPLANRIIGLLLTVAKGHTSTTVIIPHNRIHHRYRGSDRDWMPNVFAGEGWGLRRIVRYVRRSSINTSRLRSRPDAPKLGREASRSHRIELIALWSVIAAVLIADPVAGLQFVFVPWLLGMAALVAVNFIQHDGCDLDSEYDHSRNFVGSAANWLFFNNGYHTAHHHRPALHWSRLPALHRRIEPRMTRADLNQPSLGGFVLRNYLFGGGPAATRPAANPDA